MASPKIPNQKSKYDALNIRLAKYVALIQSVYDTLNNEAAQIAMRTGYDGEKEFKFSDYPQTKESVLQLQKDYAQSLSSIIYSGTSEEWKNSNLIQDLIARNAINFYTSTHNGKKNKVYYQVNSDALKAFQQRVDKGMNLSQKVWDQSGNYKQELEYAISTAIEKGTSAVTLSKQISKYLNDFPKLQKDYSEKYGKAVDCHDCEYRSMRLARSEINMAYRRAEELRWQQMDFVIGKEIKLSKRHEPHSDICDDLAGKYPKDFDWTGWHPNDMCYVIPILKSEKEFWADEDAPDFDQTKPISEFPKGFNEYVGRNLEKFASANARGTLSYWLKDNDDVRGCVLLMGKAKKVGDAVENIAQTIANERGAKMSAISYKDFNTLYRKVTSVENGVKIGVDGITDSVSATIFSEKDLDAIIKDLAKDSHWLRTKVQVGENFYGYSGNIINLKMDNGVVAEIQVNTPKMIYAKETEPNARKILGDELYDKIAKETGLEGGLGGKLYEQIRTLDKIKDVDKLKELSQQSLDYYARFQPKVKKVKSSVQKESIQYAWNLRKLDKTDRELFEQIMNYGKPAGVDPWSFYDELKRSDFDKVKEEFLDKMYLDAYGKIEDYRKEYKKIFSEIGDRVYNSPFYHTDEFEHLVSRYRSLPSYIDTTDYTNVANELLDDIKKFEKEHSKTPLVPKETWRYYNTPTINMQKLATGDTNLAVLYRNRMQVIKGSNVMKIDKFDLQKHCDELGKIYDTGKDKDFEAVSFWKWYNSDGGAYWDMVDHYHELANAKDLNKIPRRWRSEYNACLMRLDAKSIAMDGLYQYYEEVEHAYNIYKLSTMQECIDFGLDKLSSKTPWNLCKIYVDNRIPLKELPLKGFFDKEKNFYPLYDRLVKDDFDVFTDAYCHYGYHHVCINKKYFGINGRAYQSSYERKNVIYHEYGHAMDFSRRTQAIEETFDKFAKELNDSKEEKIRQKFWKEFDDATQKAETKRDEKDVEEQTIALSDVIQAMLDTHERWYGGHKNGYFDSKEAQYDEFVAHISENYWYSNPIFKKVWPELYSAMYKCALQFFK